MSAAIRMNISELSDSKNPDKLLKRNSYTCPETAIWLGRLMSHFTGNKWTCEIMMTTGVIYFHPDPERLTDMDAMCEHDRMDVQEYLNPPLGIPNKMRKYMIFADEVVDVLAGLASHAPNKTTARNIMHGNQSNND